jgi:hypothetical protein
VCLQEIRLSSTINHHSGQIPSGLGACSKLKVFRANFNSLRTMLPHDIYNELSGPISSDIVNLVTLANLELYGNKLSGKLPKNIGKLFVSLKHLMIYTNSLTGSLTLSLVNCTNLTQLILRDNFLE